MKLSDRRVLVQWYEECGYPEVLVVMEDAFSFPEKYESWHRVASERLKAIIEAGNIPTPVSIDPRKFLGWCASHGHKPNATARTIYATELWNVRRATAYADSQQAPFVAIRNPASRLSAGDPTRD